MNMGVFHWLEHHLLTCPFKDATGIDCPGCGLQRSMLSLLKGDVVDSFLYHPAGLPSLALVVLLITHLKFRFSWGARVLTALYILTALLTLGHYVLKWVMGFDYLVKYV
jgi:hypothetical protein